jgi:hypothetical protein
VENGYQRLKNRIEGEKDEALCAMREDSNRDETAAGACSMNAHLRFTSQQAGYVEEDRKIITKISRII